MKRKRFYLKITLVILKNIKITLAFSIILVILVVLYFLVSKIFNYSIWTEISNCYSSLKAFGLASVVVEDSKGFIDLIYMDKFNKRQRLASYPVEYVLVYPLQNYTGTSLLKAILHDNHFKNSKIHYISTCQMWSYYEDLKGQGHDEFLMGEGLCGSYQDTMYKFVMFVQSKYGEKLDKRHKLWPFLERYITNTQSKHFFGNFVNKNGFLVGWNNVVEGNLRMSLGTLKIRTGTITNFTDQVEPLLKFCRENYKWKPSVVITTQKLLPKGHQVLIVDLPINNWYVDCFKIRKSEDNISRISYVKKIYTMQYIEVRITYLQKWLRKFDRYA